MGPRWSMQVLKLKGDTVCLRYHLANVWTITLMGITHVLGVTGEEWSQLPRPDILLLPILRLG